MADEPTLYEGDVDVSGWVAEAQRLLAGAGHYTGEIDGRFGPDMARAVESFQAAIGGQVDGIIGNETWSRLQQREPEQPGTNNEPYGDTTGGGGGGDGAGDGDVPSEVVALGFPNSWSQWTDEDKQRYFGTQDASGAVTPEGEGTIEVAAIEGDDENGDAFA